MLARPLFVQNPFPRSTDSCDVSTDTVSNSLANGCGTAQRSVEQAFFSSVLTNRFTMDPIVQARNYIRCSRTTDGGDPCTESNNLCCLPPYQPVIAPLGAYVPNGSFGASGAGGAKSINSVGEVWNGTAAVPATSTTCGSLCVSGIKAAGTGTCSGGTNPGASCTSPSCSECTGGGTCTGTFTCPDAAARAAFSPCSKNADCSSGQCADVLGHGAAGAAYGLYCHP
jgi:hypothetical protein